MRNGSSQQSLFSAQENSDHNTELRLAPLDATFRDNLGAPLHSWFPYLEGYSPRFVTSVQNSFLPRATRILEPFAGSGTTPIVLGQLGIECAYSEANPAMAFVTQTKLDVLRLSGQERSYLARSLKNLASQLADRTATAEPDIGLAVAYEKVFGGSEFFDRKQLLNFRQLRSLEDVVRTDNGLLANCFSVAVCSSLIPCSNLKRAGDLRFKNEKEKRAATPDAIAFVKSKLISQADDLKHCIGIAAPAWFACSTASDLAACSGMDWHGVITSPPYLNGTNYIRNARLELWYLRELTESRQLRLLRNRVITSGINDVHAGTSHSPVTASVERLMRSLAETAYDSRIARMVGGYFNDMSKVLSALRSCLVPGGRVCIDIGDSYYAGIHVRTDDLLVEIAESLGFETTHRVLLRTRKSKGGQPVKQELLVFRAPPSATKPS